MALYNRKQMDLDLTAVDFLDQAISKAVALGDKEIFYVVAGEWLASQPKAEPSNPRNWAYRHARALVAGRDQLGIGWTFAAERWCEAQRKRLRMKLLNVGQLLDDLAEAKDAVQEAATTGGDEDQAKERLKAAWQKIRWNSDDRISSSTPAQDGPPSGLEGARTREIPLDSPENAAIAAEAVKGCKGRVEWRPRGRNVVVLYDE